MIDVAAANAKVADAGVIPSGVKRSEIVFTEIFCCEGDFAAGTLASGKLAAIWVNSVVVADDLATLKKDFLNKHENTLLDYAVKK